MKKTSTLTLTSDSCCTALARIWSNKFAPSDAMSRRVLFFCLSLLIVAGSYSDVRSQACNVVLQGAATNPSGCSGGSISGGAGAYWTCSFTNGEIYTFSFNNNGNTQTGGYYCINGSTYSAATTTLSNLNGTVNIGFYRNLPANTSWVATSATLTYAPVVPTAGTVTQNPASGSSECTGSNVTYTMSAPTNGTFSYFQYQWNASPPNSGLWGGSNPYTWVSGINGASVLYVDAVVSNGGCTAVSNIVNSTTVAQPSLTTPTPASQTDCNGATPTNITTSASGGTGTITYQWYSVGSNTNSGGTAVGGSSTTLTPPTTTNGTAYYYCTMSASGSGCNTAYSPLNDASVTVDAQPTILTQPTASQAVCTGASVTLSTTPQGGTGSWTYQWYYNNTTNSNSGGTLISGATSSSYTLVTNNSGTTSPGGTGVVGGPFYYYCVVTPTGYTNGCNAVATSTAAVTVSAQPSLTTPTPASQIDCNGATPTNITTTSGGGAGTITYQWYSNSTNVNTGGAPVGTSSTTLTPPTTTNGNAYYYCKMTATGTNCAAATSPLNDALVTVDAQPSILTQPTASQTVCTGATVTLSTTPQGGTGTWTYQWYYNNTTNSNSGGTLISGATSSSYTLATGNLSLASPAGTGFVGGPIYYYCVATPTGYTNGCNAVATNTAAVTIVAQPSLATPTPATQTDCNGATPTNITTSVGNTGVGTLSYQWYSSSSSTVNSGGTNLGSGNGGQTLTYTPPTSTNGTTYYYCVISATGMGCNAQSSALNNAQVIVDAQPTIFSQGATSNTPCQGVATTVSAAATNSVSGGTFSYQWYYNGTSGTTSGGTPISGASGSGLASNAVASYTLSTSNGTIASPGGTGVVGGPYYYYCVFTPSSGTGCNSVTTSAIGITVEPNQIITLTSGSATPPEFCQGTPLSPNIVYTLSGGATGIASVTGLPSGITGNLSGSTYTLSGTPTVNGTFSYNIFTNGSCSGTFYIYSTVRLQFEWWYSALDIQQYIRHAGQHHRRLDRIYTYIYIQL